MSCSTLFHLWRRTMKLLTKKEAAELLGYHPEHVMRLARSGEFPRAIKLGRSQNCAVRFDAAEVEAWIGARAAEREAEVRPSA
jgi:excisionase family DNA binding protein